MGLLLALASGCHRDPGQPPEGQAVAKHGHMPPHGGVAVVLGDEAYHLEFLHDPSSGRLQAYVLDGHMENFVRIVAESIEVEVAQPEGARRIILAAAESLATGEKRGDTSLFSATDTVLKGMTNFDAKVIRIEIRSTIFENVQFNYPKGNESAP